ncbi:hypothetical protein LP316_13050 [Thalassotalea sp. LPB0316]|uniref:hypothetical protein n=1 Tax=Thalassotalea sp. LPB0316 TaxID=2769490 RepID=UPI0018660025|nr:hypothetical protein [Thalassotalea sp. LPB0316]QOL25212.1 hypothetical protein LP316_13050 [Thalassotalea sp. LPB0316]
MNQIELQLSIYKKPDLSYGYQYYAVLDNGAVIKAVGFIINQATKFKIDLSKNTEQGFEIKQCLIPGDQDVVKVDKISHKSVTIIDKDNEKDPEDYNFIIIAVNKHTGQQVVCDPQIRNKGEIDP